MPDTATPPADARARLWEFVEQCEAQAGPELTVPADGARRLATDLRHLLARTTTPGDRDRGRELADAVWTLDDDGILDAIESSVSPGVARALRTLLRALGGPQLWITREAVVEAVWDAETSAALDPSIDVSLSAADRLGLTEEADHG